MTEAPEMPKPVKTAIIGAGRVGTALGAAAAAAGRPIASVTSRRPASAEAASDIIGHGVRVCSCAEAASEASLVLLTVSDDAIVNVCHVNECVVHIYLFLLCMSSIVYGSHCWLVVQAINGQWFNAVSLISIAKTQNSLEANLEHRGKL